MREITGLNRKGDSSAVGNLQWANELNHFFNRFDSLSPSSSSSVTALQSHQSFPSSPLSPGQTPPALPQPPHSSPDCRTSFGISPEQVRKELVRLHPGKSPGPDNISPRVLKACASQLCGVLQNLFTMSLQHQRVPELWKTSCLVPVPKKVHPTAPNDHRPIALTSHIMKVMERLVLAHLRTQVCAAQDPLQFACQPHLGVDDAIIYLLQRAFSSLDKPNTTVRIIFFDFSSAFNTIQPMLLSEKLEEMDVDAPLISWITDYLTGRPQSVRLQSCVSDHLICNTGAPQGTVLSPFLFTTYTADFKYCSKSCHLQKYSDDTAIVGCVERGQEEEYRKLVADFVRWCGENHLQLNIDKTKEMVVNFSRTNTTPRPISISGRDVELVTSYKYLGVNLDHKLQWSLNTEVLYKKGLSRLYLLRKLRSFNICSKMLHMFYQSVMASTIFFAAVCWGTGINAKDSNKLNKLIKKAGSVVGTRLAPLEEVVRDRMLGKIKAIMDNVSHPLHSTLDGLTSCHSQRLRQPRCTRERYSASFLPEAIRLYNTRIASRSVQPR